MVSGSNLTKDEESVLIAFADNIIGGSADHCELTPELQPALESLKAKGLVEKVWVLSKAGEEAVGIHDDHR